MARFSIAGDSPPAWTCGCEARICSTSVVPERGMPTMKIGSRAGEPAPRREAKNSAVNVSLERRMNAD